MPTSPWHERLTGVMPNRPCLLARANPLCGSPSLIPSKLSCVAQGFTEETWELSAMKALGTITVPFYRQNKSSGKGRHNTASACADSAQIISRWRMSYDFGGKRALVTGAGKGIHNVRYLNLTSDNFMTVQRRHRACSGEGLGSVWSWGYRFQ